MTRKTAPTATPDALRLELLRALQAKAELAAEVKRLQRELTLARTAKAPQPVEPCPFCGAVTFVNRRARNAHVSACPQRTAGSPDALAGELRERATKAERAYAQALRRVEQLQLERDGLRADVMRLTAKVERLTAKETRHGA